MRRNSGPILLGISAFFLVTALMGWFYAPGATQKTPLDTNSKTLLEGTATYLGAGPAPVKAYSINTVDGPASKQSGNVQFTSVSCLWWADSPVDCPEGGEGTKLIQASSDKFATDPHTGEAVGEGHEGLVNKFPFGVERGKTYPFWDGLLGRAVDAKYVMTENVNGLETYKYEINFSDEPAQVAENTNGLYTDTKTMWVEPKTGALVKQEDHQVRKIDGAAAGDPPALDLQLNFTADQVASNVTAAKGNVSKLSAVSALPWLSIALAVIAGLVGVLLMRRRAEH